jgi:hypothetical protein
MGDALTRHSLNNADMPTVTRSRKQVKNSPDFYVLIDKTPRNIINRHTKSTEKDNPKPKKKNVLQLARVPPAVPKSRAKAKRPTKGPSAKAEGEAAQSPHVGEPDDPLQRVISAAGSSGVFATPPRSHPPPRPPNLPEHRTHDQKTTAPPQFHLDGTPSPDPARRRSHRAAARASSLLPPSSPVEFSSSPAHQVYRGLDKSTSIFPSAHSPGSPSQFRTPTRKDRKRKRTPLSKPHLQSEGEINNDDLFAHGVVDDLDSRDDSIDWENAGSDKENHAGAPGSEVSDNKPGPSMPLASERGILQPREVTLSPTRSSDSDPFGLLATERLLKARRAEKILDQPEEGSSTRHFGPRRPLGELPATEVAPPTPSVKNAASASQSQPALSPNPRYSDSEIEDLYAPASPPHTPRERLPQAHATSPHSEATPVAITSPLTPRNGDNAHAFTMRRRRQKELHGVTEHGSEIEGSSAPSSPSPVKRVHQRPPDPESQVDYETHQESEEERPQKRPKLRGKGKGKENTRKKSSITEDPIRAARRVLENAPRRKVERRAAATRKMKTASNPVEGDSDVYNGRPRPARGRPMVRGARGQASRRKKGSEGSRPRKKKGEESTPEEVREVRLGLPLLLDV